jgi:transposase-like protein
MDWRSFQQFFDQIGQLSREQLDMLAHALPPLVQSGRAAEIIQAARAPRLRCPRCDGNKLYRDGHANGLQRFRCCACGRTFNSLTGTPLARLRRKDKWLDYCATLSDPATTVRRAAEQLGVHRNTTFRWRHRMLAWPKRDSQAPLRDIVEADEMFVLESRKGARQLHRPPRKRGGHATRRGVSSEHVCVLVARDRSGRTHDAVTGAGPVTAAQLTVHLRPALAKDVLLVTDAHAAYRRFARKHRIEHATVNARADEHARGPVHVQNVNGYHSRLRGWLYHFRGVATRYLDNYCGWRRAIDAPRISTPEIWLRAAVGVFPA